VAIQYYIHSAFIFKTEHKCALEEILDLKGLKVLKALQAQVFRAQLESKVQLEFKAQQVFKVQQDHRE
jgi:hypothetical protein